MNAGPVSGCACGQGKTYWHQQYMCESSFFCESSLADVKAVLTCVAYGCCDIEVAVTYYIV